MIATLNPTSVPTPPAPSTAARCSPSAPPPLDLSDHDEQLLSTLLDASFVLSAVARHHSLTLQQLLNWWAQPHIKAAVAALTELAQSRAIFIAADDATRACTALQSCTVLADVNFYEQSDPATRQRAFESARKAAGAVLRLAGLPRPATRRPVPHKPATPRAPRKPSTSPSAPQTDERSFTRPVPGKHAQIQSPVSAGAIAAEKWPGRCSKLNQPSHA